MKLCLLNNIIYHVLLLQNILPPAKLQVKNMIIGNCRMVISMDWGGRIPIEHLLTFLLLSLFSLIVNDCLLP